jgi:hypothetical protein
VYLPFQKQEDHDAIAGGQGSGKHKFTRIQAQDADDGLCSLEGRPPQVRLRSKNIHVA